MAVAPSDGSEGGNKPPCVLNRWLPEFAEGSTRIKHIILAVGVVALVMDALGLKLFIYLDGTVEATGMRRDNKKLEELNTLCESLCFVWSRRVTSLFWTIMQIYCLSKATDSWSIYWQKWWFRV